MKNIALVGNPNSGKTTLFNTLTGSTAHVGNWPGVTVAKSEGLYKKGKEAVAIIDLPGIYSLSPYTSEEVVARNYIIDEKPDCIINIVDATNIERNLYLTTQILEIDIPVVVALNMIDVVEKSGVKINLEQLSEKLGVKVVTVSALKQLGTDELMQAVISESCRERKGKSVLEGSELYHLIDDIRICLDTIGTPNPLFHAIKLAELDELEMNSHSDLVKLVYSFKEKFNDKIFGVDFEAYVANSRYNYITDNYIQCIKKPILTEELSSNDKADKVLTHKWFGIPLFLLIMFSIFHIVFSGNFLFLAGIPAVGETVSMPGTALEGVFMNGGLSSPGVILQGLMTGLTDYIGSLLSMATASAPEWVGGLIVDGVWGGLSAVLSFIPQILLLFLLFSILEDSGYMARVVFMLDRIFRKFGLSGRAFIPMIMGFGCSVPAMANTRTLSSDEEKVTTIRVIPFFSCGAKLPILTAIAGGIVTYFGLGFHADLITYSMYVVGIAVAIISIIVMRKSSQRGGNTPFIMELPAYHLPQFKNLMLHLWDKLKHFIKKAFTVIFASTIVIWVVSHFSFDWKFLPDEQMNMSILAGLGKLIVPIFTPLGFGSQLNDFGWVFVVGALTGLIAKENVIATFGVLAMSIGAVIAPGAGEGIGEITAMITATNITIPGLLAFIVFNMTTIPCFAAVATAKNELPTKKSFKWTIVFWLVTSYLVASVVYIVGEWWWTLFIFASVVAILIIALNYYNKNPKMFEKLRFKKGK